MFRRAFWFTAGAATGVWATTKVNRTLRSLNPDSLALRAADRVIGAGHRLKDFTLDVRAGMAQRERELNDALGLTPAPYDPPQHALPRQTRRALLEQNDRTTGTTGRPGTTGTTGKEDH